jgi:hypothetical protein
MALAYTSTTGATSAGEDDADFDELNANGAVAEAVEGTEEATGAGTEGFVGVFLSASFSSMDRDVFGNTGGSTGCVGSEQAGAGTRGLGTMAERSFE